MAFDRLDAMRAFCRIVETGSFTRASLDLNMAKTTVSGQIQSLEVSLSIKLLHRTTRRVSPTAEGLHYYRRVKSIIEEIDELNVDVSKSALEIRGKMRVEMPSPVGTSLLIPALPNFLETHPQLSMTIGCSERVMDLVEENIDCAIRGGVVTDERLVSKRVGKMRFGLFASPEYLCRRGKITRPDEIACHELLGFLFPATNKLMLPEIKRCGESYLISQKPKLIFNNGDAYITAGTSGLGIISAPLAQTQNLVQNGRLEQVLPDWLVKGMDLNVVYPYSRNLTARVKIFVEWVVMLMQNEPLWRAEEEDL